MPEVETRFEAVAPSHFRVIRHRTEASCVEVEIIPRCFAVDHVRRTPGVHECNRAGARSEPAPVSPRGVDPQGWRPRAGLGDRPDVRRVPVARNVQWPLPIRRRALRAIRASWRCAASREQHLFVVRHAGRRAVGRLHAGRGDLHPGRPDPQLWQFRGIRERSRRPYVGHDVHGSPANGRRTMAGAGQGGGLSGKRPRCVDRRRQGRDALGLDKDRRFFSGTRRDETPAGRGAP